VATLTRYTGLSERTVRTGLDGLETGGLSGRERAVEPVKAG
jgi:hypothetical protein